MTTGNHHQPPVSYLRIVERFRQGGFDPDVEPYVEGLLQTIDDLEWLIGNLMQVEDEFLGFTYDEVMRLIPGVAKRLRRETASSEETSRDAPEKAVNPEEER